MSTDHRSLVEPEGTNAGSADSTDESARATADVRGGGRPARSPDPGDAANDTGEQTELAGAPAGTAAEPGQEHGSSGQDAGSMDPG